MVKSAVERWREVFSRARALPPPRHTSRLAGENRARESRGLELSLSRLTAPHLPQGAAESLSYQLRASLFDGRQQQFLGNTWRSAPCRLKDHQLSFNQVLFLHTELRVPWLLLVVELVELSDRADSSHQARGRGFTVLELFSPTAAPAASEGNHSLNLYHGSPRSLLHPALEDAAHYRSVLKAVDGAVLECALRSHPALASALHFIPQNALLSGHEVIPGLQRSPSDGALLSPRPLTSRPLSLSCVSVTLKPSLEKFEAELLQRVNADCAHTKQTGAEDGQLAVQVQERRLRVGVHNGWGFLEPPQVLVLEVLPPGGDKEVLPPGGDKDNASAAQKLGVRSSLQLSIVQDAAVVVVFQLEYVFSAPIARDSVLSATASGRAAFLQSLRWGVWSPREGDVQLGLQGGPTANPLHTMVYQDTEQVFGERDTICFHVDRRSGSRSERVPESTGKTRKTPPSPARGPRLASPPDSPQGPGLSLSQLAGTARFPTVAHSSSAASPWQPPSLLLHPSPRTPATSSSSLLHLEADLTSGSVAPDEGPLQELPYTPIHAPVLRLEDGEPGSSCVSSRRALAWLSSAGFPQIQDLAGRPAEDLDPALPVTFDPQREQSDPLQGNTILLQFLAFTRIPGEGVPPDWPRRLYFTFQLYRFPPVTTQPLALLTDQSEPSPTPADQSQSGAEGLCLLTTVNRDGTSSDGPGLQLQFSVDGSFLRPGEHLCFLKYLASHSLHMDVWDGDSLLLLGSTALPLKTLLRQGRAAVQSVHALDVLSTEFVGEGPPGASEQDCALTVHTVRRGRLLLRTGNVGCPFHPDQQRAADTAPSHVLQPREVSGGFRGGSLTPRNLLQLNARNSAQAERLHSDRPFRADPRSSEQSQDGRRKLSCMAAVHRREGTQHTLPPKPVSPVLERSKADDITHMLSRAITQQHLLFCSLGSSEYLEFVLRNPFTSAHTVSICSDSAALSVITSSAEWRHLRALAPGAAPVEENMFHVDPGAPGPRVYLRPKESLHIPLKYQSFQNSQYNHSQTAQVTFSTEDEKPLSILQLSVQPTPHVVHQTFRLYHPEKSFMKKAIRLPPCDQHTGVEVAEVSVRCSDPDVVCQTRKTLPGEPQDVFLKVPGSPSPTVRVFSIMVYTDRWMATPAQVWQVYVHFLERVDMSAVVGQRSCQSLLLRGQRSMRKLHCYCSHPGDVQVDPPGDFALPSASVQEVKVRVQPWRAGRRFFYLSAVDVEQRRLVNVWLLCVTVNRPVVSKAFEVNVPVGEGRGSSRKISYSNPYGGPRTLRLHSDHPQLLQFREERFQVGGGESHTLGLRFAPSTRPGSQQILVFVNDQDEKTEETFCVTVHYS